VKRKPEFISLAAVDLLDESVVPDHVCRQLLTIKFMEEERIEKAAADKKKQEEEDRLQKIRDEERKRMIDEMRRKKAESHLERQLYEQHLKIEELKKVKREEARRKRAYLLEQKKNENGTWKKYGKFDWQFVEGKKQKNVSVHGSVYDEAKVINTSFETNHSHDMMNKRWKEITGRDMITVADVTDMGYGIDDLSKEEQERIKEEEMYGLNEKIEESDESDLDMFGDKNEGGDDDDDDDGYGDSDDGDEGNVKKKLLKRGGGDNPLAKMRSSRRMSITGTTLKPPTLPKIDA